jgi:hypothetical protein
VRVELIARRRVDVRGIDPHAHVVEPPIQLQAPVGRAGECLDAPELRPERPLRDHPHQDRGQGCYVGLHGDVELDDGIGRYEPEPQKSVFAARPAVMGPQVASLQDAAGDDDIPGDVVEVEFHHRDENPALLHPAPDEDVLEAAEVFETLPAGAHGDPRDRTAAHHVEDDACRRDVREEDEGGLAHGRDIVPRPLEVDNDAGGSRIVIDDVEGNRGVWRTGHECGDRHGQPAGPGFQFGRDRLDAQIGFTVVIGEP